MPFVCRFQEYYVFIAFFQERFNLLSRYTKKNWERYIKDFLGYILWNMMCYGALNLAILSTAFGLGQYCFSVLHNTSYRTQWSAI